MSFVFLKGLRVCCCLVGLVSVFSFSLVRLVLLLLFCFSSSIFSLFLSCFQDGMGVERGEGKSE